MQAAAERAAEGYEQGKLEVRPALERAQERAAEVLGTVQQKAAGVVEGAKQAAAGTIGGLEGLWELGWRCSNALPQAGNGAGPTCCKVARVARLVDCTSLGACKRSNPVPYLVQVPLTRWQRILSAQSVTAIALPPPTHAGGAVGAAQETGAAAMAGAEEAGARGAEGAKAVGARLGKLARLPCKSYCAGRHVLHLGWRLQGAPAGILPEGILPVASRMCHASLQQPCCELRGKPCMPSNRRGV